MNQLTSFTIKKQFIAEFIGTGLMVFFSTGCLSAMKLTSALFSQWEISIICGMGIAIAIYLTISISGAHLNPTVTIILWLFSNFNKSKVIPYIIAQILGSFCATALVYSLYYNLFLDYEQVHHIVRGSIESLNLASIFSSYPNKNISIIQAFIVEMVITGILLFLILSLIDKSDDILHKSLTPFIIGILIAVIGASMGPLTGFSLNPARDLGSKTFVFLVGWGKIAYTGGQTIPYFLIPLIAPVIGAFLGAFIHRLLAK